MSQKDPWGNAVLCAKAACAASDQERRAIFVYLGEFWLELARHDISQISENTAIDVAVIERLQAQILGESALH
jgi:hypothetical protein